MKIALAALLGTCLAAASASADDLAVLPKETDAGPTSGMMSRYLKQQAYQAIERRRSRYEELDTSEEIAAYQDRVHKEFVERLGGFPERTPLNAQVVGTIEEDGYRVEKLIYESQPRHYVTASLYLPRRASPPAKRQAETSVPGVVIPSGHSHTAKAAGYNQRAAILLAKHGIAALCYDPIGQGERYQLLDDEGKRRFKSTTEHTLVGSSCIPLGLNTATYRIWDGIRSIDYLASREEIDAKRIGVTGCSGGGTLSSYLMAVDRRVACAAPSCYLTSFRRLIDTIGPQDAEQNVFGQIAAGIDHADYIMLRAPKPTIMLVATHDFFDIEGAWDTFRQAKRFYTRLGFPERVSLVETDTRHGYPPAQREAMLRWMRRWLATEPGSVNPTEPGSVNPVSGERELDIHTPAELQCTSQGQTLLMKGARSVIDLNVAVNDRLEQRRRKLWQPENRKAALAEVRRITGIRPRDRLPTAEVDSMGTVQREGYGIERLVLKPEPGILLPALFFRPEKETGGRYLYLHGQGKHVDAETSGAIERLVGAGNLVLAVDLRGLGETGTGGDNLWAGNWDDIFLAYLLGKSLVAMRAEDVLVSARYLSTYGAGFCEPGSLGIDGKPAPVNVVAVGNAGPAALHAVALEPQMFGKLTLRRSLRSFSDVVRNPAAGGQLANVVHGALRAYDLPDLVGALPEKAVEIVEPVTLDNE